MTHILVPQESHGKPNLLYIFLPTDVAISRKFLLLKQALQQGEGYPLHRNLHVHNSLGFAK